MEVKSGYQQTEIGVIPEDWEVLLLNDACIKIQDGTHFSPKIGGSQYKYITSKNIGKGSLSLKNVDMISEDEHRKIYKRCDVKVGDILLTKDGINTGNAAINHLNEEFSLLSSVALLRIDTKCHDNKYLMYQILSNQGQTRITNMISGNAITRLTLDKIKKLTFPFPSTKHEQELISEKIRSIDSLITSIEKLVEKKKLIKQGVMQELLTGKRRLPGFTGKWETKKLGELANLYQPQTISQDVFTDGGYNVWGANGIIGKFNKYNHKNWQTTISCRGNCGSVNKTDHPCWITGNAMVVNVDNNQCINKLFLYYKLSSLDFSDLITGSGQPQIVRGPLSIYALDLPGLVEEQKAIASILHCLDKDIASNTEKLFKYQKLKQGIMQELLTGRIRLV